MKKGVLLLLAVGLSGCSSGLDKPVKEVTATMGTDQVQHIKVKAHAFWFEPNRIVVQANHPVELKVSNSSWFIPHNLTITAPETDVTVSADVGIFGRSKTVTFTPTTPGEYPFHCHVDKHGSKKGMKGMLVVK